MRWNRSPASRPRADDIPVQYVVPEQWDWGPGSPAQRQPEARLMLAVLEEAISTLSLQPRSRGDRNEITEAERWFSCEDLTYPFSFVNVCRTLGIDASHLRHGLAEFRNSPSRTQAFRRERRRPTGTRTQVRARRTKAKRTRATEKMAG
jgi:hypothetical protein